jgi:hypothetical protein
MEETLPGWIGEEQVGKYGQEPRTELNPGTQAERHHEHLMIVAQARKTQDKHHQC